VPPGPVVVVRVLAPDRETVTPAAEGPETVPEMACRAWAESNRTYVTLGPATLTRQSAGVKT
jgi:hypothetical protein